MYVVCILLPNCDFNSTKVGPILFASTHSLVKIPAHNFMCWFFNVDAVVIAFVYIHTDTHIT